MHVPFRIISSCIKACCFFLDFAYPIFIPSINCHLWSLANIAMLIFVFGSASHFWASAAFSKCFSTLLPLWLVNLAVHLCPSFEKFPRLNFCLSYLFPLDQLLYWIKELYTHNKYIIFPNYCQSDLQNFLNIFFKSKFSK